MFHRDFLHCSKRELTGLRYLKQFIYLRRFIFDFSLGGAGGGEKGTGL